LEPALDAYGRAIELCRRDQISGAVLAVPLMNALVFTLRAGARKGAVEHARWLDECVAENDGVVRQQVAILRGARAAGLVLPREARSIADELDVRRDGAAREVVDALV
jgi:hypothetical protein